MAHTLEHSDKSDREYWARTLLQHRFRVTCGSVELRSEVEGHPLSYSVTGHIQRGKDIQRLILPFKPHITLEKAAALVHRGKRDLYQEQINYLDGHAAVDLQGSIETTTQKLAELKKLEMVPVIGIAAFGGMATYFIYRNTDENVATRQAQLHATLQTEARQQAPATCHAQLGKIERTALDVAIATTRNDPNVQYTFNGTTYTTAYQECVTSLQQKAADMPLPDAKDNVFAGIGLSLAFACIAGYAGFKLLKSTREAAQELSDIKLGEHMRQKLLAAKQRHLKTLEAHRPSTI
ncbi:MAG: hypothetical protein V4621_06325 [Pseudomonadota bacterium]